MNTGDVARHTVLTELIVTLTRVAAYNAQVEIAPAVVLWPDKARQWEPLVPRLREALPRFLTLGPYKPEERTGPAIWIKCMLARTLPGAVWPAEAVPVLYLPGVSRHELRAVDGCPQALQPLAELQYRGVWFTQENTKDWTVYAFLTSKRGGLRLDIAGDDTTREAVLQALGKLADTPVAELRGQRLHAANFRALLQPDLVKQLLRWLDAPAATCGSWTVEEWQAFRGACQDRYGFDPEQDGELVGAERLGTRQGNWEPVWQRFAEAPAVYPHLPELLRRAKPQDEGHLFFRRECWPQCNEEEEHTLYETLGALERLAPEAAVVQIERLEAWHGRRRDWVWAKLGHAPLARALEHLARLARVVRTTLGGETASDIAAAYAAAGWQADAAVLDALAEVTKARDVAVVRTAVRAVYKPWLEATAERFQERVRQHPGRALATSPEDLPAVSPGTCIVFADGLRLDLGKRLRAALEREGCVVTENWRWAPWPPVTPTAKPLVSPVADLVTGEGAEGESFLPAVRDTRQPLTADRFRRLLSDCCFQVLGTEETGDPEGRAWTECGDIDRRGHEEGWKLAQRIGEELAVLVDRIRGLLEAGWKEVRLVTNHGWLLLPGGLPKVEVPQYLVESRWARCGTLKPGTRVDFPLLPGIGIPT
jgi:hypothetical protein